MGTKGATGSKTVLLGSNTVKAMEKIRECPVLAIPKDFSFRAPKEIVFPTDYKEPFKRSELNYLLEIGKMHQTSVAVLHLNKKKALNAEQENNQKLLDDILGKMNHEFFSLTEKNLGKGIQTFVESRNSDIENIYSLEASLQDHWSRKLDIIVIYQYWHCIELFFRLN